MNEPILPIETFSGLSPFSGTYKARLNDMADTVYRYKTIEERVVDLLEYLENSRRGQRQQLVRYAILGSQVFAPNRWLYTAKAPFWDQASFGWIANPASPSVYLLNAAENLNTAVLVRGVVQVDGTEVVCRSISVGRSVWCLPLNEATDPPAPGEPGPSIFEFSEPNDFTVTCPEPPPP